MAEQTTSRITDIGAQAPDEALDNARERLAEAEAAAQRGAGAIIDAWDNVARVFVPPVLARRAALVDVTFDVAQSSLNVSRDVCERLVNFPNGHPAGSTGRARRKS